MRRLTCWLALTALPLPLFAAPGPGTRPDVSAELKRYYQDGKKPPAWKEALKRLSADDAGTRSAAAGYLRALLQQALDDEHSGDAPWHATPFWGSSGSNPARVLREEIAEQLAKEGDRPSVVPVLRWYFEEEVLPQPQAEMMKALARIDGKEADDLRARLAGLPHANEVVAVEALRQMGQRKAALPADRLAALCQHHRSNLRQAARDMNRRQGGKEPGPFDPVRALRSPPLARLLERISDLVGEKPPAGAKYVALTSTYTDKAGKKTREYVERGWLLADDEDHIELQTPHGWRETYFKKPLPRREGKGGTPPTRTVAVLKIEDEVARVEAIRKKDNEDYALSERGGLTGQFQGRGASLYEVLLGQWLWANKRQELATRILLPALDTLYSDEHLYLMTRDRLGTIYGQQMLAAFVGDRDYARAEKLAGLLVKKFPDTRFHDYAVQLAEQLPRRRDDFGKLRLPTPREWAVLEARLPRSAQIDYLCRRMRLLNCFQEGQPGGYQDEATQYAEPCGISRHGAWGQHRGRTPVINPLVELKAAELELTLDDVPQLAPYLKDDWFMLIVSFWRDFHPARHLASTRPVFARIINGLAHRHLCQIEHWGKLSAAEIDREIERIIRWARANAGKTSVQLEWERLDDELRAGGGWTNVEGSVGWLLRHRQKKALEVMGRFLESDKTQEDERIRILRCYREHDPAAAKDLVGKYLDKGDLGVRLQAALLLFEVGEHGKARPVLGKALETGNAYNLLSEGWLLEAAELLGKEGSEESRRELARVFANKGLKKMDHYTRARIFRVCAGAGLACPYRFYQPLLDIKGNELEGTTYFSATVAETFADEITEEFAHDEPDVQAIVKRFPKPADRAPELKKWLQKRAASRQPPAPKEDTSAARCGEGRRGK